MAPIKCCVVGCASTDKTHRLYNFPKDDKVRALWLSFLVSVNSELLGLTKDQLLNKRVCQKHFDKYQLDGEGNRLRHGYPCLFSTKEVEHGVPLSGDHYDHSYSKKEDFAEKEDVAENSVVIQEHPDDHSYSRTADIYADPPASSLVNTDITTANVFETNEIQSTSKCEQSSHLNNIQIDSLESQDVIRNVEQSQSITKSPKIIGIRGRGKTFYFLTQKLKK
ncbi:uncharacterized protein LOC114349898 isoform X2 [Ostrinia furnacalis]|uniref:uncharacterized protein LOC114349898 isoform X2 n=1 Tax=Ostrinia furnacalis TaxID=93504 RepID=UPI001040ABB3|nr:uncharacterized protein LOC114349898 isoform X2 [Ostrinia furnacalis]